MTAVKAKRAARSEPDWSLTQVPCAEYQSKPILVRRGLQVAPDLPAGSLFAPPAPIVPYHLLTPQRSLYARQSSVVPKRPINCACWADSPSRTSLKYWRACLAPVSQERVRRRRSRDGSAGRRVIVRISGGGMKKATWRTACG